MIEDKASIYVRITILVIILQKPAQTEQVCYIL